MTDETRADPDGELARRAAAGDGDAFTDLVRRHESAIVNLVRALTGGDADADDLAQETFIRAYRGVGRFRADSTFRTWLHTIAVNVVRSHRTQRSRWRRFFVEPAVHDDGTPDAIESAATPGFEGDMIRRDAIDRALARLPEDLRAVVTLRDVQGLDYREIAEVLQLPMGTVESRLFRARQRLRPLLAGLTGSRAATPVSAAPAVDEG